MSYVISFEKLKINYLCKHIADLTCCQKARYIKLKVEHYLLFMFSPPKISYTVWGIKYICFQLPYILAYKSRNFGQILPNIFPIRLIRGSTYTRVYTVFTVFCLIQPSSKQIICFNFGKQNSVLPIVFYVPCQKSLKISEKKNTFTMSSLKVSRVIFKIFELYFVFWPLLEGTFPNSVKNSDLFFTFTPFLFKKHHITKGRQSPNDTWGKRYLKWAKVS